MTCLNREAFLKKLFLMYPANFTTENAPIWKEAYEMVLPENLNFDKLFYKLVKDYKSIATAPAPAWFEDYKETCKEKQQDKALAEIKKLRESEGAPPPPEFFEAAKRLREKQQNESLRRKVDAMGYIHD